MCYNYCMPQTLYKTDKLPKSLNSDDGIDHIYCSCNHDVSLCGFDISDHTDHGMQSEDDNPDFCIVCLEVEDSGTLCLMCSK